MASFDSHIKQANENLAFLNFVNSSGSQNWGWQVTFCFYTALHIVNAHLAKKANLHYRTHEDVKNAINPTAKLSICAVPEPVYLAYVKLENLSRRARYLCSEDKSADNEMAYLTYDKHFAKAARHLDLILDYFQALHSIKFDPITIACLHFSGSEIFKVLKVQNQSITAGRA